MTTVSSSDRGTAVVDKKTKRIDVLRHWRRWAAGRGHPVPTEADLDKIGSAGELWPPFVDVTALEPWRETIAFLLKQIRFGVNDPVDNLPLDLWTPTPAASPLISTTVPPQPGPSPETPPAIPPGGPPVTQTSADAEAAEDPRFVALRDWRSTQQQRNQSLGILKDSQLRTIVNTGSRTADEVRRYLPASWVPLAQSLADALAKVDKVAPVESAPPPNAGPPPPPAAVTAPVATAPAPTAPAAPPPAAAAAPPPPPAAPPPVVAEGLEGLTFVPYDYAPEPSDDPVLSVRAAVRAGVTTLAWPPYDGPGVVVYRVVSRDEYSPFNPDDADVVAVTTATTATDDRAFITAVRFVQVWRHVGPTAEQAAATQPVKHARIALVAPVQDASVTEDAGRVIGYWTVLDGASRVQVHRVPLRAAERVLRLGAPDAQYRQFSTETNLTGFIDAAAERGQGYLYQMWVEADTGDGTELSPPVVMRVELSAVLAPVRDLVVTSAAERDAFDLSWTAPRGADVLIFRTARPPDAGASLTTFDDPSALPQAGLEDKDQLRYPWQRQADGRCHMPGVPWPEEDTRAYFTPVTKIGRRVRVGMSVPAVRMRPVEDVKIVERTAKQVVTFAWPEGATSVVAFIGPPNVPLEALRGQAFEITHTQYVRQGGLHLQNTLPPVGCTVHLLPVAYSEGERIEGAPVTVDYPGLIRLRYLVEHQRGGSVAIAIVSEFDLAFRPLFALVYNPTRLPLMITDGVLVPTMAAGGGAQGGPRMVPPRLRREAGDVFWTAQLPARSGYIRVFVDREADPTSASVALIDPPITRLRLGSR